MINGVSKEAMLKIKVSDEPIKAFFQIIYPLLPLILKKVPPTPIGAIFF